VDVVLAFGHFLSSYFACFSHFGAACLCSLSVFVLQTLCILQDVDVEWFLKQWDGQYNTEWQSRSEVIVRFTTPQALKEALTALGGGIRGVFRVDRG